MIKKFTLGAVNWSVVVDNERLDDLNLLGLCEHGKAKISLYDKDIVPEFIEQTFYHELVHAILESLDRTELSKDEQLVQSIALLLHQFENTKSE